MAHSRYPRFLSVSPCLVNSLSLYLHLFLFLLSLLSRTGHVMLSNVV